MKNIVILSLVAALSLCPATMHGKKKQKKYAKTEVSLNNSKPVEQPMTPVTITNAKKQLEGEWDIVTLRKKPVSTPDRAYLYLDFKNFKVYGSTGCNDLNGRFQQSGTNINFKDFITTERACHSATRERDILKALAEVQRMTMSTQYNIEYLNLMNSKGQVIMVLKHHNLDLMNGVWIVREADGVNVRAATSLTASSTSTPARTMPFSSRTFTPQATCATTWPPRRLSSWLSNKPRAASASTMRKWRCSTTRAASCSCSTAPPCPAEWHTVTSHRKHKIRRPPSYREAAALAITLIK